MRLMGCAGADVNKSERPAFERSVHAALAEAKENDGSLSIGIVDIDMFRSLNEAHGRSVGDAVIDRLAALLRNTFTWDGAVWRYGGDAFAILWRDLEKEQAFLQLEGFRAGFSGEQAVKANGRETKLAVTISGGLASYPDDGLEGPDVINKAVDALYRAKVKERSRICLAREERMVTKTSHYTQGQLLGLRRLAEREAIGEAVLLREALNDLLRKHNA